MTKEKEINWAMFELLKHDEDRLADMILAEKSLADLIADTVVEFETGPFKCSAGLEWVEEDCILIDFTTLELEEDSSGGHTFDTMRWANPQLYYNKSDAELFGEYVGMVAFETGNLTEKIHDTGLIDVVIDFNAKLDDFALNLYAKSEDFRMAYDSYMADKLAKGQLNQSMIRRGYTSNAAFFMCCKCDFIHPKAVQWAQEHRASVDTEAVAESYKPYNKEDVFRAEYCHCLRDDIAEPKCECVDNA